MKRLCCWLAFALALTSAARAADLPGAWVELAADGGLDVRALTMSGMACPEVVADGAVLASKPRGTPDPEGGAYPIQVCVAHAAATVHSLTVEGLPTPDPAACNQASRDHRRHRLPSQGRIRAGLQ
jgi:hypothetical protein